MADEDFSPETHRFAEPRYFDDFRLGERFYIPSRTNQDKELVMDGLHRYLLRRKR